MNMVSGSKHQTGIGATEAADVIDVDALMQANVVRVFNERNSDRRRAALAELYAEDQKPSRPDGMRSRELLPNCSGHCRPISSSPRPGMLWATTVPHDSFGG
jgi:hypothetical protein